MKIYCKIIGVFYLISMGWINSGQANYLGISLRADIIKQKLPTNNGGFKAIEFA
jgi:hypothetical protein